MDKVDLKIDWATHEAAKYAVEHWHYSRTMPKSKLAKIGVWEDGIFIGVVLFGVGATADLVKPYGLKMTEGCELVRVALKSHKTHVSRIIAIAIKKLKQNFLGLRLIVSFADTNQGHTGAIYQAGNWIYSGMANDIGGSVIVNGKQLHGRAAGLKYGTRSIEWLKKNVDPEARPAPTTGKHRYLMPLDKDMAKQIEHLRKPYPKKVCVTSIDSDAPVDQTGEGGASPTVTLHQP